MLLCLLLFAKSITVQPAIAKTTTSKTTQKYSLVVDESNPALASKDLASTEPTQEPTLALDKSNLIFASEDSTRPTLEDSVVESNAAPETNHSDSSTVETKVTPETDNANASVSQVETEEAPKAEKAPILSEVDGIAILSPVADSLIPLNERTVVIQFPVGQKVSLWINGQQVDEAFVGQVQTDPVKKVIKQTWYDLDLKGGTNTVAVHRQGESSPVVSIPVHVSHKTDVAAQSNPSAGSSEEIVDGVFILAPTGDRLLDTPSSPVVVQSRVGEAIELRVNGIPVDDSLIGRTETETTLQLMRQTWYGVVFNAGENTITVHSKDGSELLASTTVQVRGEPEKLKLGSVESRIPADGQSTATITGQLLDAQGNRSSWTTTATLYTSAGKFVGVDENPDSPGFQVEVVNGEFTAQLQSDVETGLVQITASSSDLEGYHQLRFDTALRKEPLFTGVVDLRFGRRGTNYFKDFEDFLPLDGNNRYQLDAKVKAFGNASIGEWSITGAVDSEQGLNTNCNGESSLFRAQGAECEKELYPTFGDNSSSTFVAPSKDNVYLKIERSPKAENSSSDYFMWGDYNTEEFSSPSQQYSAINRSFHGFKGNYNIGRLQLSGFYGKDVDGFQRDTIAPDGTRGFYFLSRRALISGSEKIFFEVEELNRPGTVIDRIALNLGEDYDIDYDRGTILFRRPVLRTDVAEDGTLLARRIIATYQFEGDEENSTSVYGGRVKYNFSRNPETESWLGATYFLEDRGAQSFELYGADAQVKLGKDFKFIAEYAHSTNSIDFDTPVSGEAFRAEVEGSLFDDKLSGRAYWRTTDEGFSNNATTSFVPGQTRYGGEITAKVTPQTSLRFSYDHEDNFGVAPAQLDGLESLINPGFAPTPGQPVDNSLTTIRGGIKQTIGKADLSVDWVHRDRKDNLTSTRIVTDQISSRFKMPLARNLSLHAYNDFTLSNESDPLYPTRTTIGLDWQVHPSINIGLNQTYLDGGQFDNDFLTTLDINAQHTFKTGTTVRGQASILGDRGMAGLLGVDQAINLAPGLKLDLAYEHVFNMPFKKTAAGQQFEQPFAVGSGASSLGLTSGHSFSAGLAYNNNDDFQANARLDYRISSGKASNMVITANALGKITPSLSAVGNFRWAGTANQTLEEVGNSLDLKVGLAYRNPNSDKFNGLLRYEYRENPGVIPETLLFGRGTGSREHLLAVEGVYTPSWRWELYGKLGVRHSSTRLAKDLVGSSTVGLGQLRLTHRLNYRWDVSADVRLVTQPSANYRELGGAVELGYYLNPNLRLAAGYAFGSVNDSGLGNSRSSGGPYLGFTVKLDNNLLKDFGFGKAKRLKGDPKQKQKKQKKKQSEAIAAEKDIKSQKQITGKSETEASASSASEKAYSERLKAVESSLQLEDKPIQEAVPLPIIFPKSQADF